MTLALYREPTVEGRTFGALWIDGLFQCFTLEDAVREIAGQPVEQWKVKGETAIPFGRYRVVLTLSPRFKTVLPELLEVPGFSGARIHAGNFITDTEGCILVGRRRQATAISQSRVALRELMDVLASATDDIWIEIRPVSELAVA
jgi:hypothetical protein